MERNDLHYYSNCLNRDMNVLVYGNYGLPIIVFPCQNGDRYDWEINGMIDNLSDYIEEGKIKLYCIDSVDKETWSDTTGDNGHRSYIIEQYYYYVMDELVPFIKENCQDDDIQPFLTGSSQGANQAAIMFLRRPDLFSGFLSMSSVLNIKDFFFGGWSDERLNNNNSFALVSSLPKDHYYIDLYNSKKAIFVIGQGEWEVGLDPLRHFESLCQEKGISFWFDYWGYDVSHNWNWWYKQIRYFLPKILDED